MRDLSVAAAAAPRRGDPRAHLTLPARKNPRGLTGPSELANIAAV